MGLAMNKTCYLLLFTLAGCSVSPSQLSSRTDNLQAWQIGAPISEVFQAYKSKLEEKDGFAAVGANFSTSGFFYGDSAELSTKMEGMQVITCIYINMEKTPTGTAVKAWRYSDAWSDSVRQLRAIFSK
jgi:hypothetical protein